MPPLIHTIRRVYRTCGPPNEPLVRGAHEHDWESGLLINVVEETATDNN